MKPFENSRWCFVDGMRGIAALGVVFCHLAYQSPLQGTLFAALPLPISLVCTYGEYGVQIFFVISGFVIAHSLRDNSASVLELRNFIFRRQLRLDPPYWAAMIFALVVMLARNIFPGYARLPMPTAGEILANACYLQWILGTSRIVGVAWTLCLEVQFYLFFILLLAVGRLLRGGRRSAGTEIAMILVTGAFSIIAACAVEPNANIAWTWFPFQWLYFAGGVLCYLSVRDRRHDAPFAMFIAFLIIAFSLGHAWRPTVLAGLLAMLSFWGVGKTGRLTTWLGQEFFQYFGRISYSLYLIHAPITIRFLRFGYELSGENKAMALVWFSTAFVLSVAAAHVFHHWVERPSMRLAARFKRSVPGGGPAPVEPTPSRPTSPIPGMATRIGGIEPA